MWRWQFLGLLLVLVSVFLPMQTVMAADSCDVVYLSPPLQDSPTQIEVSLFIIEINDVDEPAERFEMDTYITLSWVDERLASDEDEIYLNDKAQEKLKEMWLPNVQFNNQVGEKVVLRRMLGRALPVHHHADLAGRRRADYEPGLAHPRNHGDRRTHALIVTIEELGG